tara:strand:+ start:551 stop:748 length:198 start_codon:yes stop_codon:yes gene_type:complete
MKTQAYFDPETKKYHYYLKCDRIIEQGICTEDELSIAVHFGGASMETLEKLIKYKTYLKTEYSTN